MWPTSVLQLHNQCLFLYCNVGLGRMRTAQSWKSVKHNIYAELCTDLVAALHGAERTAAA